MDDRNGMHWVGTWATTPDPVEGLSLAGQTVRMIARLSIGGAHVRVRLSRAYGARPLAVGAAHLAVSVYLPDALPESFPLTGHDNGHQTNYVSVRGNLVASDELPVQQLTEAFLFVSGVEVLVARAAGGIAASRDSLTEGNVSQLDGNNRRPDQIVRGLTVHGGTLLPFEHDTFRGGFCTPEGEANRQAVDAWIRAGGAFDAVIDFDAAPRDPDHPARLLPRWDAGDHLHPSDVGDQHMADSIDLALFDCVQIVR